MVNIQAVVAAAHMAMVVLLLLFQAVAAVVQHIVQDIMVVLVAQTKVEAVEVDAIAAQCQQVTPAVLVLLLYAT
jgi:hypothetical protein